MLIVVIVDDLLFTPSPDPFFCRITDCGINDIFSIKESVGVVFVPSIEANKEVI